MQVVSNNPDVVKGTESDIKVFRSKPLGSEGDKGEIVVDLVINWMETNEIDSDLMDMSYAAGNCIIKNASLQ